MAGMRVMQIAKKVNLTNKETVDKLNELGFEVKSHASVLDDETSKKAIDALKASLETSSSEADLKSKNSKSRSKKATTKKELNKTPAQQALEARKAKEQTKKQEKTKSSVEDNKDEETSALETKSSKKDSTSKNVAEKQKIKVKSVMEEAAKVHNQLKALKDQVKDAEQKAKIEAAIKKNKKRMEVAALAVQKQREVMQKLQSKQKRKVKTFDEDLKPKEPKRTITAKVAGKALGSLMDQISSEKERLKSEPKKEQLPKKLSFKHRSNQPEIPELEELGSKEDKYSQMAAAAEKMHRDKLMEEARAAVVAASHDGEGRRQRRKEKREAQARQKAEIQAKKQGLDVEVLLDKSVVEVPEGSSVAKFAELLGVGSNDIIKRLFMLGQALTLTQTMSNDLMELIADDIGCKIRIISDEEEFKVVYNDTEDDLKERPPVVTVMGHVDHGKTSLLDAIRNTSVIEQESGGITQHIGASVVFKNGREITFIDTPGHEAFTAMRARGAQITDVVVLVVAADDSVMPQTIEAINHAKEAKVPVVVAVNKIDKEGANPDKVRQQLTEYDIIPEEWGGKNIFVDISAKKNINIDELLEAILLQADVLELKSNPSALASGFVVESNLDKGRGPVATLLVRRGTLMHGDVVVAGRAIGKIRALIGPGNKQYRGVEPGEPVEVLGLDSVCTAGDEFRVFDNEREARKLVEQRRLKARIKEQNTSHMSLDDMFEKIESGEMSELNLIIKSDVQGSIEALVDALGKIDQSEVKINVIHSAVGGITETDVNLASASNAIIVGFNVRPTGKSKQLAESEKVDIRTYSVIYKCIEDINAARVGMLSPDIVETDTGTAEVKELFKVSKVGTIAGCYVSSGEISKTDLVRVVRDGTVVHDGNIASLRHYKDDVTSIKEGSECGITIENFADIHVGDIIEAYKKEEVERKE